MVQEFPDVINIFLTLDVLLKPKTSSDSQKLPDKLFPRVRNPKWHRRTGFQKWTIKTHPVQSKAGWKMLMNQLSEQPRFHFLLTLWRFMTNYFLSAFWKSVNFIRLFIQKKTRTDERSSRRCQNKLCWWAGTCPSMPQQSPVREGPAHVGQPSCLLVHAAGQSCAVVPNQTSQPF